MAMGVLFVMVTWPEATKMAPLVKALTNGTTVETKVLVTAQHCEMLDFVSRAANRYGDGEAARRIQ
jgi:UDP-N-acetylglucosamine 2-epimerase